MITIREAIIQAFASRASVIRVSSPAKYSTNLGIKSALRARPIISSAEFPCVCLWPLPETAENKYGKTEHKMIMRVEGIVSCEDEDQKSIISEQILGDLIKCFLGRDWIRSPEFIISIAYTGGGPNTPKDEDVVTGAYAEFTVIYQTAIGDPCAN